MAQSNENRIRDLALEVVQSCTQRGLKVATAESCTGGLISAALTDVAGSSAVFDRGFVTYSNEAKHQLLNVPLEHTLDPGAVSELVACEMVSGAIENSDADIAVSVTGIAGPGGGTAEKPVGLVYISSKHRGGETMVQEFMFSEDGQCLPRQDIRALTVIEALSQLLELSKQN